MRIACLLWEGNEHLGILDSEGQQIAVKALTSHEYWATDFSDRDKLLSGSRTVENLSVTEAELLPPVSHPPKLLCVAANYLEHMRETGRHESVGEPRPQLFMKPPTTSLRPHRATVYLPPTIQHLDYEAELAVVIGDYLYQAPSREAAMEAVAGYSAFNDLSERRLRVDSREDKRGNTPFFDWLAGKWINGSAPMGPWLVTRDEIPDPQDLTLQLYLNGELMQSASTADMLCPVADIVWYASQIMTLEPGDIIATGTPAGVGIARRIALKPGDTTDVVIEKIGTLTTRFAKAPDE
ncbi:MAG: fumarylacetoacetate hydrolase family protein [Firmicutes bacterium]|jgi:2-keto-4-pentenoate hydratase/2-oxohepta-3-ene-1,7-dioic acid hydratase in catechol pathway|nr:fumarylacetoacetate hydrolase family protein [Bacillota bacterium]